MDLTYLKKCNIGANILHIKRFEASEIVLCLICQNGFDIFKKM